MHAWIQQGQSTEITQRLGMQLSDLLAVTSNKECMCKYVRTVSIFSSSRKKLHFIGIHYLEMCIKILEVIWTNFPSKAAWTEMRTLKSVSIPFRYNQWDNVYIDSVLSISLIQAKIYSLHEQLLYMVINQFQFCFCFYPWKISLWKPDLVLLSL